MLILELLAAMIFALVASLVLTRILGRTGPGPGAGFLFFFLLLSVAIWAGGIWMEPFGPSLWGVTWLTFLVAGLVITVVLAAVMPPVRRLPVDEEEAAGPAEPETPARHAVRVLVFGLTFWLAIALLFGAVVVHYAMKA